MVHADRSARAVNRPRIGPRHVHFVIGFHRGQRKCRLLHQRRMAVPGIGKRARALAGAGGSTNDDTTRNCLQVRNLALSKRGLLHIAFFLILSELE